MSVWQRCGSVFDDAGKRRKLSELEKRSRAEDFWAEPQTAQRTMKELAELREETDTFARVQTLLDEAAETLEVLGDEEGAADEADSGIAHAEARLDALEMAANFDREFDSHGAIVTINAGAGGIDAADWAEMLARMYMRWAERKDFSASVSDASPAEEAGLKSITFFVRGKNAYGMLESERGVHRLVRISPFDQQHRRQTSFA